MTSGHTSLARDCGACHRTPFVRVRDHECLACHRKMPGHIRDGMLQTRLFGDARCAQCHKDHRGTAPPIRTDAGLCVPCHANLRRAFPDTTLENAGDFAKSHPNFRLTLWRGPGMDDVVRVKQSDPAGLVETSNLKFPHDKHLKPGIKAPQGRVTLECRSCHVPDASAMTFVPIDMNRHCGECHALNFEPAVKSRHVAHGSVEEAWLTIQEFYARIALGNVAVDTVDTGTIKRQLPMASAAIVTDDERRRALAYARSKAQQVGIDLFEKRVCIVCHDVRRSSSGTQWNESAAPWNVPAVHIAATWMPKARFDHARHRTAKCIDCHQVEHSHHASDVAIPAIGTCRECHAGNTPIAGKVVSTCVMCHGYHLVDGDVRKRPQPASARAVP